MSAKNTQLEPLTIWNKNFICVMLANFMLCVGHASVNPLVATYTNFLNAGPELTGFLAGMFFAVSLALKPFAGPILTKLDKRLVLIVVFLFGAVANFGYAMFQSIPAFVLFRFFSGVQYGLIGALLMTLAADHLPKTKLTYGLGIYGISGAIGNAVGPSLGDTMLRLGSSIRDTSFGFRLMFLTGMVMFLIATIPATILAPDRKTKEETDGVGSWYKNILTVHALPPTVVLFLLMISYSLINTYIFEFSKEQSINGISVFYIVLAAALAITRPLSGYITDKLGIQRIMFPALLIFAVAMFTIGSSNTLLIVLVGAVLAAVGFGASQPSLQAMCMQSETTLKRGVASNTIYIGIDLGLFLGPYLGGLVYARTDYAFMYKIAVVPVVLAIICFAIILPIHKKRIASLEAGTL